MLAGQGSRWPRYRQTYNFPRSATALHLIGRNLSFFSWSVRIAAVLSRQAFFAAVRAKPFGGALSQSQVDGMSAMLHLVMPAMDTSALAYCFATAHHETGGAMQPRVENLNYTTAA